VVTGRLSYSPNQISPGFALGALVDVSPSAVANGQILIYRSSSGKWVNESPNFTSVTNIEEVQGVVGAMMSPSTAIRWTYSDPAGKLRAFFSPAAVDHGAFSGLGDDDHTQYHTAGRADTWLGTKSTTNLIEGSNLYFTNERAQDAVGSILTGTSTIRWVYDDAGNTISAHASPANIPHNALSNLTTGDPHTQYQLRSEKGANNGYPGLDSSGFVSPLKLGSAPATGKVLFANNTWASPGGGVTDHGALIGLGDDDHTQYHTAGRADTWLGTKSTTDLAEGANLYYTDERAQDAVGGMVSPSAAIRWSYNDTAGKIQAVLSPAGIDHGGLGGLSDDDHTQYHTAGRADTWLGTKSTTNLSEGTNLYHTDERVQDVVGAMVSPSSTIRWSYNDPTGKIQAFVSPANISHNSLSGLTTGDPHTQYLTSPRANTWLATKTTSDLAEGSNLYFTDERAQDVFGAMVSPSSTIRWVYDDAAGKIQAFVSPANISHSGLSGLTIGDPHTQYQLRSEKNQANGYMGLDSSGRASPTRLGSNTPSSGVWLRGDGTWQALPAASAGGDSVSINSAGVNDANFNNTLPAAPANTINVRWQTSGSSPANISAHFSPGLIDHGLLLGLSDDDHAQYQLRSERNAANGYVGLDASGIVSPIRLGASPAAGEVLYGNNLWQSPRLNNSADVKIGHISALANRHHLVWLNSIQRWVNELYETTISSSTDVDITTPSNGQLLFYEDETWYNLSPKAYIKVVDLLDVSPTSVSNGQVLTYHAASGRWRNASPSTGAVDHGALTGLSDDDHPQYQQASAKNTAGGYPGLDAAGRLSPARDMYAYRYVHTAYNKVDGTATQDWFSPNPGITLSPGVYEFFGMLRIGKGATSAGFTFSFGGTATYDIAYTHFGQAGAENTQGTAQTTGHRILKTAATGAPAGTQTTTHGYTLGTIYVTATGTVRPQFALSATSNGTVTVRQGTFWRANRRISSPAVRIGAWV